jgi:hypothetical protein
MGKGEIDAIATVDDVFGNLFFERLVHVLAINSAKPPRTALTSVLGKRARPHWDILNARLQPLKKKPNSKTAPLSGIAWDRIQDDYIVSNYEEEVKSVPPELVEAVQREVEKSIRAIRSPRTEMECTCVLFSLFRDLFDSFSPRVKMNLQHNLRSLNNVLEAAVFADFVFYHKNTQVCVMEAKKVNLEEDEEGEECEDGEAKKCSSPISMRQKRWWMASPKRSWGWSSTDD